MIANFGLLASLALFCDLSFGSPVGEDERNIARDLVARSPIPVRPTPYTKTLFEDGFDSPTLDMAAWRYDLGTAYPGGAPAWGTGEVQTYTNSSSNIMIDSSGNLQISPRKDLQGGWTSARIETKATKDFSCPAGGRLRVQARIKVGTVGLPQNTELGIWPAFWMLGAKYRFNYQNWPAVGEIDIMETLNGRPEAWQIVHCGVAPGGPCNEWSGVGASAPMTRGIWHVVRFEINRQVSDWHNETLAWYIDGVKVREVTPANLQNDRAAWDSLAATRKMLLLNVAVGGSFPDAIAGTKTPTAQTLGGAVRGMAVDYITVWST